MSYFDQNTNQPPRRDGGAADRKKKANVVLGLIVMVAGFLALGSQFGLRIPGWLFSWRLLLIIIGFLILIKNDFKGAAGYILIAIGAISFVGRLGIFLLSPPVLFSVMIVGLGIYIIVKAVSPRYAKRKSYGEGPQGSYFKQTQAGDYLSEESIFGSVNKKVLSKNFVGGSLTTVFGGIDIDLMQAEFEGEAVLDVNCIFGGIKLILPSDWQVHSEVDVIFGGLEDKRPNSSEWTEKPKVLIIKGFCLFGGIEIKGYK